jgi:hypothetical protein
LSDIPSPTGLRTAPAAAVPLVAAFYLAVLLAPSHHLTLLITGTIAILGCWFLAGRWGVDANATGGLEMLPVFVGVFLLIGMPMAMQVPVPKPTMVAVGLGTTAEDVDRAVAAAERALQQGAAGREATS